MGLWLLHTLFIAFTHDIFLKIQFFLDTLLEKIDEEKLKFFFQNYPPKKIKYRLKYRKSGVSI